MDRAVARVVRPSLLLPRPRRHPDDAPCRCTLSWGRLHIGNVPVPYDDQFQCCFPEIATASVQRVACSGVVARAAGGSDDERYVVALKLRGDRGILDAINRRLSAR